MSLLGCENDLIDTGPVIEPFKATLNRGNDPYGVIDHVADAEKGSITGPFQRL